MRVMALALTCMWSAITIPVIAAQIAWIVTVSHCNTSCRTIQSAIILMIKKSDSRDRTTASRSPDGYHALVIVWLQTELDCTIVNQSVLIFSSSRDAQRLTCFSTVNENTSYSISTLNLKLPVRLRVVALSLSPSCVTRKRTEGKNGRPQGFQAANFSSRFSFA